MIAGLRARVDAGASLDSVLPDVFAVVAEAWARVGGESVTGRFRTETAAAYQAMWPRIRTESVGFFFHLDIEVAR